MREPITRERAGAILGLWHASQSDPLYAVGSYWRSGMRHPQRWVVERAELEVDSLSRDLKTRGRGKSKDYRQLRAVARVIRAELKTYPPEAEDAPEAG